MLHVHLLFQVTQGNTIPTHYSFPADSQDGGDMVRRVEVALKASAGVE